MSSNAVKAIAQSVVLLSVVLATAAFAQAPSAPPAKPPANAETNAGVGDKADEPKDVDKGQNMILPSAGSAGPSAAPTMVYDCAKKPQDCTEPATPADKGGASHQQPIKP